MTFLPIVERELRVAARRRGMYWTRVLAALAAVAIGAWFLLVMARQPSSVMGESLFGALSTLAFIYALLAGVQVTSDCLSEEKRDGTLGLLFLTDLKGYDVVLGKLAATSLNSLYGMVAIFPVMAIPLLLGGVTPDEFWRVTLVCLNILFLSLATGMFASAISRHERKAMGATFLFLLLLALGPPALVIYFKSLHVVPTTDLAFMLACPPYSFTLAFDRSFVAAPGAFWQSVAFLHFFGWCFILLASRIVTRTWQDKPATARGARWRERWQLWSFGDAQERRAFRTRLLEGNPILWLAGRNRLKYSYVWGFLGVCGCLWLWGWFKNRHEWLDETNFVFTAFVLHTVFKLWLASEACHRFNEDRNLGALELLLSTPLTIKEILGGQLLALQRQFSGPVLVVLAVDICLLLACLQKSPAQEKQTWALLFVAGMTVFVFDLVMLSWVGMWRGLTSKRSNRAFSGTIVRVLVLPWLFFGLIMMGVALVDSMNNIRLFRFVKSEDATLLVLGLWFALSFSTALFFGSLSCWKLHHHFRTRAMERYAPEGRGRSLET